MTTTDGLKVLPMEQCSFHNRDLPVHRAATNGEITQLASLLKSIDDIDVRDNGQRTSLHLAIRANNAKTVHMLLTAGASPNLKYEVNLISQLDLAAVNSAAYLGSQDALAALLDYEL